MSKKQCCNWCGEFLYETDRLDPYEHCGKPECSRAMRDEMRAEREEAHERLDRDMGWDRC
ncbi:MAG: hypothetical protein NUV51_03585 [Sulfuricaulis sp.]|nr:hypothetical protein [Sulfuricaulis sp.]